MSFKIGQSVLVVGRKEWQDDPYFYERWFSLIGSIGTVCTVGQEFVSIKFNRQTFTFNPNSIRPAEGQLLFSFMYN